MSPTCSWTLLLTYHLGEVFCSPSCWPFVLKGIVFFSAFFGTVFLRHCFSCSAFSPPHWHAGDSRRNCESARHDSSSVLIWQQQRRFSHFTVTILLPLHSAICCLFVPSLRCTKTGLTTGCSSSRKRRRWWRWWRWWRGEEKWQSGCHFLIPTAGINRENLRCNNRVVVDVQKVFINWNKSLRHSAQTTGLHLQPVYSW